MKNANIMSDEKIAIIGDLHLAPKAENASIRTAIVSGQEKFLDNLVEDLHSRGIKKAIFCGDMFTNRSLLSVIGLEYAIDLFRNRLKDIECFVIAGNHDLVYENSASKTSVRFLELLPNVHVFIDTIGKAKLAGKQFFFVPWIVDQEKETEVRKWLEKMSEKSANTRAGTVIVGHFDIFGALMESNTVSSAGIEPEKFTDACGLTISGHYHCKSTIERPGARIVYVGSPYHLSFAHVGTDCGYYIYDGENMEFVENTVSPRFIDVRDDEYDDNAIGDLSNSIVRLFINKCSADVDKAVLKNMLGAHNPLHVKTIPYGEGSTVDEAKFADDEEVRKFLNADQLTMAEIYIEKHPENLPTLKSGKDPATEVLRFLKEYDEQRG